MSVPTISEALDKDTFPARYEVVQKHDVKHIRTLHTKNGKTCEVWYYGKTKVNSHNLFIRITISGDTQSIELFAVTPVESLAGLLAEIGREIKSAIDSKLPGTMSGRCLMPI